MVQVGFDLDGEAVSFQAVGGATDLFVGGWPVPLLLALREEPRRDWRELHPSDLGKCLRQRALRWDVPYYGRPEAAWAQLVGTGIHRLLAEAARKRYRPEECLIEERLELTFEVLGETLILTGQIDLYHRPSRTLIDYKTTRSVWKKELSWEYELQQNCYLELLRAHGEEPEQALLWFVETQIRRPRTGGPGELKTLTMPVPIWPREELWAVLEELGTLIVRAHRDGILPPAFRPEDPGFWQCRFCPVRDRCRQREQEGS